MVYLPRMRAALRRVVPCAACCLQEVPRLVLPLPGGELHRARHCLDVALERQDKLLERQAPTLYAQEKVSGAFAADSAARKRFPYAVHGAGADQETIREIGNGKEAADRRKADPGTRA